MSADTLGFSNSAGALHIIQIYLPLDGGTGYWALHPKHTQLIRAYLSDSQVGIYLKIQHHRIIHYFSNSLTHSHTR